MVAGLDRLRVPQARDFYALEKCRSRDRLAAPNHRSESPPTVNTYPINRLPSLGLRFTALFSAVVVVILSVFSASPALHAWLHAQEQGAAPHHATAAGHDKPQSDQDEDGCAIVMFANGVIAASLGLVAIIAVWQFINLVVRVEADVRWQSPRYWLPPLCGPPLR